MKISVNGEARDVLAADLASALVELGFGDAKVATAVNSEFVPTALRASTELSDGDRVEVLAPMQGG